MKPFLMGSETEYSMSESKYSKSSLVANLRRRSGNFHEWLLSAVRRDHCWLSDIATPTGIYIDNGSRYYLDAGNHNELSSPEVESPCEIASYDRAGERILLNAKAVLKSGPKAADICITKNNINFSMPDIAAWGQHEAYTCWIPLEDAAAPLIPHLVSRIPYAGAGCLSSHPNGMGFELSQRSRHMTCLTGRHTTHTRAIFCTRAWKRSDVSTAGWTRTNLISKDSQRCSFGMYLSFGITGMLFMILNEGHQLGSTVQLKDPLSAMRAFSIDPWLKVKVPLASGKLVTAIDIQRVYLREAERIVTRGDFPDWTGEVLDHWATTLDQLEKDPMNLADRLDTYVKMAIFDRLLTRAKMTWASLREALQALEQLRGDVPSSVVAAVLSEDPSGLNSEHSALFHRVTKQNDIKRVGAEHLRFAMRLQALELNYHELGGLFDQMATVGKINPVVITEQEVNHAIHNPPSKGRANARSQSITKFNAQRSWQCDWQYTVNVAEKKWVDLRDPFTGHREITPIQEGFFDQGISELMIRRRLERAENPL